MRSQPSTVDPLAEFLQRLEVPAETLRAVAKDASKRFATAEPFPHVVIDDLFDPAVLRAVIAGFPGPKDIDWERYDTPHELKLATRGEKQIPWPARLLIGYLNSSTFLEFVEEVSGMSGLIPDPHLAGGGLHQIPPGGKLGVHTDFLLQQRLKLDRRLNIILYLNEDWQEEYGGHLELWARDGSACVKKVLPVFNRLVLFHTTGYSYHGHPEPLRCPPGRFRRSVALYYYTNGRPAEEHGGLRPTSFVPRPGERVRWKFRQWVRKLIPPILLEMRYWFRR